MNAAVPKMQQGEFVMHAVSHTAETPRKRGFQDAKRMGGAAASTSLSGSTPSNQEVPLSQLNTPLAAGGPSQYGLPTVGSHVKTDLA